MTNLMEKTSPVDFSYPGIPVESGVLSSHVRTRDLGIHLCVIFALRNDPAFSEGDSFH
jgi:hypothetical protein